ncbi:hypothetical protein C7S18_09655 [Ahniella affigens]|uniref:FAD-binding FR-type domain-containing protein n=1 Tax=Ahniella affigens TaxID=2021234 RepID=A0A2P1PRI9_9GAMM|nr:iron-sulfur cluster-binding domain-containing protein [Ahniella affigens]AVP97445.1 hypothetical protein C7S18_09655 [Ahniella affigens]
MAALMRKTRTLVQRGLRSSALAPLNDVVAIDRLLQRMNRRWSLRDVRATLVAVTPEAGSACSVWLKPNRLWNGHEAGQHIMLEVEIDGTRHHRAFSLSAAPRADGLLRLTLRVSARALVSRWLQDPARVGDVVTISQAQGTFVLPTPRPDKILMVAAGSGISPLMAMLEQLAAEHYRGDIQLLRIDRQASDVLLDAELAILQRALPGLHVRQHFTSAHGRLTAPQILEYATAAASRRWFVCGPEGLMQLVRVVHAEVCDTPLLQEHFAARALRDEAELIGAPRDVLVSDLGLHFQALPGQSLLLAAEAAGLNPKSGCRAGICRTCLCQKTRGRTRNLLTNQSSDAPDEWIQLCISTAESDLELTL